MKKYIVTFIVLLSAFICANAQQYLRYHMRDNTFFSGFYTDNIESITHDQLITCIKTINNKKFEINIGMIDSVSFENDIVNQEIINDYRIYEFNQNEGNIKKIIVDNRASLFASQNGDFGPNDTILFASVFNDITWLFITNEEGQIKQFFDGNILYYFDYDCDDEISVLDLTNGNTSQFFTKSPIKNQAKAASSSTFLTNLKKIVNSPGFRNFASGIGLSSANTIASNFANNINGVGNNPELRNQMYIVDGLSIAGDLIGLGASIGAEIPSFGWSTAGLIAGTGFLLNDLKTLLDHLFPGSEQMKKYEEYYKDKYSISLRTLPVENKSFTSATLCGELKSTSKLTPKCSFLLYGIKDEIINGQTTNSSEGLYKITGNANNLTPGSIYFYYVTCTYIVDGLELSYTSSNYTEFYTPLPQIETGSYQNNGPQSTTIYGSCIYDWDSYFENLEEPKVGFAYSSDGSNWAFVTSNLGFDGTFSTTLDIHCITNYWYKAYVEINGVKLFGQEKQFLSAPPSLDGVWHVVDDNPTTDEPNEYDIYIQGNTATWSRPYKEGGGQGSVGISADGTISIGIMEEYSPGPWSPFWRSWGWSGKVNDKDNPTSVTGTASKLVGNSFHDNLTEFSFTMTR